MTANATSTPRTLVIATSNLGKLAEIRSMLEGQPVTLLRPVDVLGHSLEVVEDGDTFEANAEKKAREVATATGHLTLADDSGLEVDILGGLPGVRSARFAGEGASDAENNAELLRRLQGVETTPITARFRCAMALFDPSSNTLDIATGRCEGAITREPRGTNGFGYDPLFVVTELGTRTIAELPPVEKNAVSHRGRALNAMLPRLLRKIEGTF
jgi:XTP/dITP diphosphohydrolase